MATTTTDWRDGLTADERHDVYVYISARFQDVDPDEYAKAQRDALAFVHEGRDRRAAKEG